MTTSKIQLPGRTENGELLQNHHQQQRRKQWLIDMKQSNVIETLEREPKSKSPNQLGYIFGVIIDCIKRTLDDRGEDVCEAPYTREQIKRILYFQHHVKNGGTWENFGAYKGLSGKDMAETSDFIDSCLHYAAVSKWRICVPDPRPRTQENNNV